MPTVTFSEQPVGTINPIFTFSNNTLRTVGRIVTDGAQPASPAIAANTSYLGPVFLYFLRPVTSVSLAVGYFDNINSTRIEFRDAQGHVLASFHNQQLGVRTFGFSSNVGIASVVVIDERADAAGFSVDTVEFGPPISVDPPLVGYATNPLAGVDRYYGEVGSTSLIFHETLGAGDTVDTIAFYAQAAGTVTFHIALDSDPANTRAVSLAVIAGHNRFSFQPPTTYTNALGYTARFDLDLALPSKEEAMDRWISEIGEKILGGTLDFQEFKFELLAVLQQLDNADDGAKLLGKIGKAYGWAGLVFDLGSRIHAVAASGNNWREETFVQATDLTLQTVFTVVPAAAGTFVGTPLLGLIGGFTGSLVYTFGLSDGVQDTARQWYRMPDPPNFQSPHAFAGEAAAATINLETLRFDPVYYLAQHADARDAVASGTFASAYLHYLAVGAALGYRPSVNVAPIPLGEIAVLTTPELARQGYNSALFATATGGFAGDGLSAAEAQFNAALDDARTDGDSLDLDRTLTAVANRVARDAVLNRLDPPGQAFDASNLAGWIAALSNGKSVSQSFSSLASFSGLQMFAIHSAATSAEEVLAAFLRDPASAAALFGPATKSVGIGEFGGVWVLIFSTTVSSVLPATEPGPLDVVVVGDAGSDALYAGGGRGTLSGGDGSDELVGGAFADRMDGGGGDDLISGGAGDDLLAGGAGSDRMLGGFGNDVYYVDDGGDLAIEAAGQGTDRIAASVSYILPDGSAIETLEAITLSATDALNFTGNALTNILIGNNGVNILRGGGGSDLLYGLGGDDFLIGGANAGTMHGGAGNDTYYVADGSDAVIEAAGEGTDRIAASVSYALRAGSSVEILEAITQSGTDALNFTGNAFNNTIVGNNGNNVLRTGDGNDTLYGLGGDDALVGGSSASAMYGGTGNDTYYITDSSDAVIELAGEGNDRIAAAVSYALVAGSAVELIEAVNQGATNPINLTGNAFNNVIVGNNGVNILRTGGGNDTLYGMGGDDFLVGSSSSSIMYGGAGNDNYYVSDSADRVIEAAGEGNDRIAAAVSYTLFAGSAVETLEANTLSATDALNFTGNALNNILIGNNGANVLRGGGGNDTLYGLGGNDVLIGGSAAGTMRGGAGDDTYYVSDGSDAVIEAAGEGADRIAASVTYTLAAGSDVEVIEAINQAATTALNLTGSDFANTIAGNNGANVLNGRGGSDTLYGFGGADTFAFTSALGVGNVDRLGDFASGTDKIALENAVFAGLAAGSLSAAAFVIGSAAADSSDRIIYNSATGQLFFDADGNGAGASVLFATVAAGTTLAASDFTVI